jgi:acetylornithine deacetylase/succinyl-diaminopimelate desuccinylase-like protein
LSALLVGVSLTMGVVHANEAADAARAYREQHESEILAEFREFLSLPNVAADRADMERNADWLTNRLAAAGFHAEVWRAGGAPYVFAEKRFPGAEKTILIYAHFDGQPVEVANWASPPWQPTLRSGALDDGGEIVDWDETERFDPAWRIYARSAGDDKAPPIALLAALAGLDAAGITPNVNIKLILDGEEEAGSPTLAAILAAHGAALDADLMLFCDGPMHQSRMRQLVFGVRGSMTVDLTTYGAIRPLHSGHYGNWSPNPTDALIHLLAAMKDRDGNIIVPGYFREVRPISHAERAAIAAMPRIEDVLRSELALGRVEGDGKRIEELVLQPAIIVKGFQAGGVGKQSRNVIQPSATASLNLRLVADQTPEGVRAALESFFREQGLHVVTDEPTPAVLRTHARVLKADWRSGGYPAFRTRLDSPAASALIAILDSLDDQQTLLTPTMGGSLPIYLFESAIDTPIILLPVANHDNNQHGRNENLRLQNLWDAIEIYAAVLADYGKPGSP